MSTLLIDNYDSYTYNVFHLLASVSGEEPIVVHNDAVSWRALARWDFDAIVLSPGPGRPDRWHDFGVCADVLRMSEAPVLGICLGHQGLGHALEAEVTSAPLVMHGRLSKVHHNASGLFRGLPQELSVVRYHSLAVTGLLGSASHVTAWTDDGVVMGIEHGSRPMWGVQFHPESIATEHGHQLIENFYAMAAERKPRRRRRMNTPLVPPRRCRKRTTQSNTRLLMRRLEGEPNCELVFERLFGGHEHAFWLDSALAPTALGQQSFMGTSEGTDKAIIEYDVERGVLTEHRAHESKIERCSIFDWLQRELHRHAIEPSPELPAGLLGGYVGYLGYECKADCGAHNTHRSDMPDALMMYANRVVAVDHTQGHTHIFAICEEDQTGAERWLQDAATIVAAAIAAPVEEMPAPLPAHGPAPTFSCGRGRERYLADIARCQTALAAGESYEVCLTDQIHTDASPEPWSLYRLLRRRNPAPFGAFLKLGRHSVLELLTGAFPVSRA